MKKVIVLCVCVSLSFSQTLLDLHLRLFSDQERIQQKMVQQMRLDSAYDWRVWGILNNGVRSNLVGGKEDSLDAMPQAGFDRSYALTNGRLFFGSDLSGSVGYFGDGDQKISFLGYGLGGYLVWKNDLDVFASLSFKMFQVFQNGYGQWFNHLISIANLGGGKRFWLNEGYFFDLAVFVGSGLISATNLLTPQSRLNSTTNVPFGALSIFSMGRQIAKDAVRVSISPMFNAYAKGGIYEEKGSQIRSIQKSKTHFDLLLSIDYDVRLLDQTSFFLYADFNAAQLEVMLGFGFRMELGENTYTPLEYPSLELKNLKKTYLK